jgi:FKBP-type peptidyl-prolyl cis-trans isomerase
MGSPNCAPMFRTASVWACLLLLSLGCQSKDKTAAQPEKAKVDEKPAAAQSAAQLATANPAQAPAAEPSAVPAPADVAAAPADAQRTASGLVSKILKAGTGKDHPKAQDRVSVHYSGWTKDGKMFDSSVTRGAPASFGVNQVIPGWTEALQLMVKGEKRRLWIPSKLAYGDSPRTGAPKGDLTFDVELLDISAMPEPPPVPKDVKEPPKTAKKTASGLAYTTLKKGTGTKKPKATDRVRVHYTGWTTDGRMFDSSVARGQPAEFPLSNVIKGWTEGVQLMKVGDKMRFWIPPKLAYGETPAHGAPAGMLVFDIELLDVL